MRRKGERAKERPESIRRTFALSPHPLISASIRLLAAQELLKHIAEGRKCDVRTPPLDSVYRTSALASLPKICDSTGCCATQKKRRVYLMASATISLGHKHSSHRIHQFLLCRRVTRTMVSGILPQNRREHCLLKES